MEVKNHTGWEEQKGEKWREGPEWRKVGEGEDKDEKQRMGRGLE